MTNVESAVVVAGASGMEHSEEIVTTVENLASTVSMMQNGATNGTGMEGVTSGQNVDEGAALQMSTSDWSLTGATGDGNCFFKIIICKLLLPYCALIWMYYFSRMNCNGDRMRILMFNGLHYWF